MTVPVVVVAVFEIVVVKGSSGAKVNEEMRWVGKVERVKAGEGKEGGGGVSYLARVEYPT